MESLASLVIVLGVVLIVAAILKAAINKNPKQWPFYPTKPLTTPEQILYFRLIKALPNHIVLAQVQLSRFLLVKKGHNQGAWWNRINRMSADFVVCAKDATVVAVIELDDATHNTKARKLVDQKKDKAVKDAGLRLIRWNVKTIPTEATILAELVQHK